MTKTGFCIYIYVSQSQQQNANIRITFKLLEDGLVFCIVSILKVVLKLSHCAKILHAHRAQEALDDLCLRRRHSYTGTDGCQ